MSAKHTPASWRVTKYPDTKAHTVWALAGSGNGFTTLANVKHPNPHVQEANARLIAAAPEMLEVLKRAEQAIARVGVSAGFEDVPGLIRFIIEKAEGRE